MRQFAWVGMIGLAAAAPAQAGDQPLYKPAPSWAPAAPLPDTAKLSDGPAFVILDLQQRVEDGTLFSYTDAASRIVSAEMLGQMSTLTLPWLPDKGDLIVHELSILRGPQTIDLLAQGQKFSVLRREQTLEQREITGVLTATLAVEGLQVGDILRIRATTTAKDAALAGRGQSLTPIMSGPVRMGFARLRYSWPTANAPKWKVAGEGVEATATANGAYTELNVAIPAPKQPEMPHDAPARYLNPPLVELSTFADWADVSKVMAPLYVTEGTVAPGSPVAAEVAAIMRAEATPIDRAQRALEVVQDKIRYLAVGMEGGNYIPQKPARTWELRYGDCKAKTLLLLAMLRAMDIEAEPVLAHISLGDAVPSRLPSALVFNHVLVRASVGGETFWMDGTGSGSRMADIRDTPPFRHVLPVRAAGADLIPIPTRANARPLVELTVEADESTSVDLPSVFEAKAIMRGQAATMMALGASQVGEEEKRDLAVQFFQPFLGDVQIGSVAITPDPAAGHVTLSARGVATSSWRLDERRHRRSAARMLEELEFAPDRARAAWKSIPVVVDPPTGMLYRLRVRLPDGGRGFALEGDPDLNARVAGHQLSRTLKLADGMLTVEERMDSLGGEIPPAEVASERDKVATVKARAPRLVAPEDTRRRWDVSAGQGRSGTQMQAIEAIFAQAITNDPEEPTTYESRASFRSGIGDYRGARADLDRALKIEPTVDLYLRRAALAFELGDLAAASADAEAARELDPASVEVVERLSWLKAESGDLAGGIALLDERIAVGGDTRSVYREQKAALIGEFGDAAESVKLYGALIEEKPGSPSLLNGRCWIRGIRMVELEAALKDCTESIELASNTAQALDSRAMVYFRLGRNEEALRDLNAVLAAAPSAAESRFLRAVVLTRLGRREEAARDLNIARRLEPSVERSYARYGLKL
ncbi:MAG TPA: tetratricopeptide repeat protein [Allosphingosinicella sp.]